MAAKKLAVLTGAGISAESGLRTFRDSDGLWEGYDIHDVATPEAWARDRRLVLDFYNQRRRDVSRAGPNAAHLGLAALQDCFDVQIITQNIDDLHERAGSRNVLHLHGEIFRMRSERGQFHLAEIRTDIEEGSLAPDGGHYRPDIVWFGEAVPMMEKAAGLVREADLFAVVGTSLVVYPAASLVDFVRPGCPMFLVDKCVPTNISRTLVACIEQPATIGVREMAKLLREDYC